MLIESESESESIMATEVTPVVICQATISTFN